MSTATQNEAASSPSGSLSGAAAPGVQPGTQTVICLGPWYEDASAETLGPLLTLFREALGPLAATTMVAYPASDSHAGSWEHDGMRLNPYLPAGRAQALAVQTASTYLNLFEVMRAQSATCGLMLGSEAEALKPDALRALVQTVLDGRADLAIARYQFGPNEALINASILQPLARAVFGVKAAFPLAPDLAMSFRMAERMATAAQRRTTTGQSDTLLWPVSEAAVASFPVAEVDAGIRELPQPPNTDLATILNTTAASLFADIEAKAAFWQRTRPAVPTLNVAAVPMPSMPLEEVPPDEIRELVESFRIGYGNLHEIWSLVLPPQTLLGLKRLSRASLEDFTLPDSLWVRIVYDFVLAHRLRTINRGHLMGSLAPLYLAWVASHILSAQPGMTEPMARAFEADKPYLVSRWRWPDRFNP